MPPHRSEGCERTPNVVIDRLTEENLELRARLEEAEDALRAIREGEVDAVIVSGSQGDRVFSLMETENLHRLMVETMNEAGLAISPDGLLLYANDRASALLNRGRSQLLGHPILELAAPHDSERLRNLLEASRQGIADDRVVFLAADGAAVPMHLWASRLDRPAGAIICLVGTDLSRLEADRALVAQLEEQQQALSASRAEALDLMAQALTAREQAAQAAHELRESDRRKDAFLAVLAHELRNPLAPISNALEILRLKDVAAPAALEARELMDRQLAHLVRLVDDLLEVSRITHGKIELRREPIALASVIDSAVETVRPLIDAAGQCLVINLPAEALWLEGDPTRLSQIFGNLLNNAAKYSEAGQEIRVEARAVDGGVLISVQDNGVGIPAELLPRVFDMFARGHLTPSIGPSGLGIGLSLVQKLVELHGGHVEAFSAGPGRGSELMVFLPLRAREGAAPPAEHRVANTAAAAAETSRILVVDDNRDAAKSLAMLLELKGAEIQVSYDGPSALAALEQHPPDAVILDIGMPGMNGLELARRIRARPEYRQIALIAMTGLGEQADRQRSLDAGFDRHLVKPISFDALDAVLRDLRNHDRQAHPPHPDPATIEARAAPLIHDLAQPLSSAGCYALAARALAAASGADTARLRDALSGVDQQIRLAGTIMERLRETLRSTANPAIDDPSPHGDSELHDGGVKGDAPHASHPPVCSQTCVCPASAE
ncbi:MULTISPECIES: ATP-binding protein [unclassified Thiocapsa]|uniref:hybrid sensor histidine kinase/response regulator n=1 Tax=unclassified Thiocapsa TaxID=2641286 RepID=UPI0035B4A69D